MGYIKYNVNIRTWLSGITDGKNIAKISKNQRFAANFKHILRNGADFHNS